MGDQTERFKALFAQIMAERDFSSRQCADYLAQLSGRSHMTVYGWLCDSRKPEKNTIDLIILKINAGVKP